MPNISVSKFKQLIWEYYKENKRKFPWRETKNPYHILVSEIMLQQTQASRVIEKYTAFIKQFPTMESLANATNSEVLKLWSGLGYNRRALYLKRSAQIIVEKYNGKIPNNPLLIDELPGIGMYTACAIITFSYNKPLVFIETNIRRVFIHFFFHDKQNVDDKEIYPLVEKMLDKEKPKEWYFALMDYGALLGKLKENPNLRSRHYTKQSPYDSSVRKVRGAILRLLLNNGIVKKDKLTAHIRTSEDLLQKALNGLIKDNTVTESDNSIKIND